MALTIGGRCETVKGPGWVVSTENATRWKPASILVELDTGGRRFFTPLEVWEPGSVRR